MPHNDSLNLSLQIAGTINKFASLGLLTDAMVSAAQTKEQLKSAVRAIQVHHDQSRLKVIFLNAIDHDPNLTDANIQATTTVAGLIALLGVPASYATSGAILD